VSEGKREVMHLGGLAAQPGPPYVQFQVADEDRYACWVSLPPTMTLDALDSLKTALNDDWDSFVGGDGEGPRLSIHRYIVGYFGYTLTADEDALLTRYEATDTGPDFWAAVDAAGLRYVAPEEEAKKRRRPEAPRALGTYPELTVIDFAAADAPTHDHWAKVAGGGLEHTRKKAGLQVRFAPSQGGDRWSEPTPAAVADDLFDLLEAHGGLDTVCLNQVVQDLAVNHEHEDVTLDDLGRMIGRDPRSTKDREAMRRDLWGRLKFLDGLTVWGMRKGTYRDPKTRKEVPIVSQDALYLISSTMWPEQRTLDGTDVPVSVAFAAGALLAQFRGRADVLWSFGQARLLLAIPRGKVSGAWAFSIGRAATQRWRELASYGGEQGMSREYLLTQFPPDPTVQEVLNSPHPARARRYFSQALAELKTAGVIADYSEPDPKTLPRTNWGDSWLKAVPELVPPTLEMEAAASIRETRTKALEKAQRDARRDRKRGPKTPQK